jgi:hypothetical protein
LNDKGSISLWNFSIRRKLDVPGHPPFKGSIVVPNVLFGFGFDPISDDHKIVGISYTGYGNIPDGNNAYLESLLLHENKAYAFTTTPDSTKPKPN